jgi:hypothetical protein
MFILDPNLSIPDPGFRVKKIPDPGSGSAAKNLSIFKPKNLYDPGVHPGSIILIFYPSRTPDPGVKKAPAPGPRGQKGNRSRVRICNTGQ